MPMPSGNNDVWNQSWSDKYPWPSGGCHKIFGDKNYIQPFVEAINERIASIAGSYTPSFNDRLGNANDDTYLIGYPSGTVGSVVSPSGGETSIATSKAIGESNIGSTSYVLYSSKYPFTYTSSVCIEPSYNNPRTQSFTSTGPQNMSIMSVSGIAFGWPQIQSLVASLGKYFIKKYNYSTLATLFPNTNINISGAYNIVPYADSDIIDCLTPNIVSGLCNYIKYSQNSFSNPVSGTALTGFPTWIPNGFSFNNMFAPQNFDIQICGFNPNYSNLYSLPTISSYYPDNGALNLCLGGPAFTPPTGNIQNTYKSLYYTDLFPSPSGFRRKYPRTIWAIANSGIDGQCARLESYNQLKTFGLKILNNGVSNFIPASPTLSTNLFFTTNVNDTYYGSGVVTPKDDAFYSGRIFDYISASGGWILSDNQLKNPDFVDDYGLIHPGDYCGPWILDDIRDAINNMRYTFGTLGYIHGFSITPNLRDVSHPFMQYRTVLNSFFLTQTSFVTANSGWKGPIGLYNDSLVHDAWNSRNIVSGVIPNGYLADAESVVSNVGVGSGSFVMSKSYSYLSPSGFNPSTIGKNRNISIYTLSCIDPSHPNYNTFGDSYPSSNFYPPNTLGNLDFKFGNGTVFDSVHTSGVCVYNPIYYANKLTEISYNGLAQMQVKVGDDNYIGSLSMPSTSGVTDWQGYVIFDAFAICDWYNGFVYTSGKLN